MKLSSLILSLASLTLSLALVTGAHAAPGDLDTSFSGDGRIVETALSSSFANAIAIQADGKIVVVGSLGGDFLVARYNVNGTRDTTFSGDGIVVTDFGSSSGTDSALAVAIQGDGKIVVAGNAGLGGNNARVGVARYNANGTLDGTFSGDGLFTMDFVGTAGGAAQALAIQSDGRIVIVGSSGSDFAVARLNSNGTLDTTFGPGTGIITKDFGSGNEGATAVAILADGRIVVAGTTSVGERRAFAWDYLNSAGTPFFVGPTTDTNGAPIDGARHTFFGGGTSASATSMAIQADGKVVLVGNVIFETGFPGVIDRFMGIARYNVDGTMDATFSTNGRRGVDFGDGIHSFASGVAVQADGKIVVVGHVSVNFDNRFAIARFNTNGSLDSTFSGDGLLTTDFSAATNDTADAVALQKSNGRIVVAGSADSRVALTRYHAFVCNSKNVTMLGTDGPDVITGTAKPDIIHGLGGNDFIDGSGGDDTICGGDGSDTLIGGTGNDTLLSGPGGGSMSGNDGTDVCIGGQVLITDPPNSFSSCETINTGRAGVSGEWLAVEELCNRSEQNPQCRLRGTLRVFNPGEEPTVVRSAVAFFVSDDAIWDENDSFLATEQVPNLDAGGDVIVRVNIKLPEGVSAAGAFIIAIVDFYDDVPERNETNNIAVSAPVSSLLDRANRQ